MGGAQLARHPPAIIGASRIAQMTFSSPGAESVCIRVVWSTSAVPWAASRYRGLRKGLSTPIATNPRSGLVSPLERVVPAAAPVDIVPERA